MIRTYAKISDSYYNHYGPEDDWKVQYDEVAKKWCLYAKSVDTSEWELLERARSESGIDRLRKNRLADHDFFLKHPVTDTHKVVQ